MGIVGKTMGATDGRGWPQTGGRHEVKQMVVITPPVLPSVSFQGFGG